MENHFQYQDIEALAAELPEDIAKRKWHGDLRGADRLIGLWLERDIPCILQKKLLLEREILRRLPLEYPYTCEEAFRLLRKTVPDLTEEEFFALRDQGKIDWIYIDGEERFFNRFAETLLKVNASVRQRAVESLGQETEIAGKEALTAVIKGLREQGGMSYRFRIRASLKIKDQAFRKGFVRVHLPVPKECAQMQNIRILNTFPQNYLLASAFSPQRAVCFEEELQENREFFVEYEYVCRADYMVLKQGSDASADTRIFAEDLKEQLPHIRFTPYMREMSRQITCGAGSALEKARRIYDYITQRVEYSFVRNYFTIENLAEYAAVGGRGDCGIQALMFITLCRIAGVPARWQSGLYVTPHSAGCHDWAQVYIAPYGWRCVDCSFGGSAFREGDEERRQFYFGNLDPFRMVANTAFQSEFDVPKSHLRADPYDNQRGEAEYMDRGLTFDEFVWKAEVLEAQETD